MNGSCVFKSVSELSQQLADNEITAVELTQQFIERKRQIDDRIKAFLFLDEEKSLREAEASDKRRAQGKLLGPLDGIPVGIKDVISEKGQPMTCGSKILKNYICPYDATVIEKLKSAGAILLGRLNMDEFAMGSSTETSAYQKTCNPWNLDCVPGGSSGGSAAAVSAGEVPLALGSDTGGSIRQPASYCGVVGIKPTYGLVSRYGLSALASSTDQVGPFARNVRDLSMLLQVIAGHDPKDSTSHNRDIPNYWDIVENNQKIYTIGIPEEYFGEGIDLEVRSAVEKAIAFYKDKGYKIKPISLPHTRYAVSVYCVVMMAEASSNLSRFDGIRYSRRSREATNAINIFSKSRTEGFGNEVKRRIILGTFVLSGSHVDAYYVRAQKVRTLICNDFKNAFANGVDVILCPTAPTTAFKFGEKCDPLKMYLSDICTVSASLAGLPAMSLPCGFSSKGLPIGFQLIGNHFQEDLLLSVANQYEKEHMWSQQFPEL